MVLAKGRSGIVTATLLLACMAICFGNAWAVCLDPPPDMIGWWTGDSNTEDLINQNDGVWVGTPGYSVGMVDDALDFDGNSYLEVPHDPSLNLGTSNFTVDFWFRHFGGEAGLIEKLGQNIGFSLYIVYWVPQGDPPPYSGLIFDATGAYHVASGTFWMNVWNHVAVTVDRSDPTYGTTIYVNGQPYGYGPPPSSSTNLNNTEPMTIGYSSAVYPGYLDGDLDELEIFDRALTPTEVLAIYNAGSDGKCRPVTACIPAPGGMAAWWPLDESSGSVAMDLVHWNSGSYVTPTSDIGKVGRALRFHDVATSTSGDVVVVPNNQFLNFGNGSFSIDAWVYHDVASSPGYAATILEKDGDFRVGIAPGSPGFHIHLQGSHNHTQVAVPLQQWTHVAITVEQNGTGTPVTNGIKHYVNGQMMQALTPMGTYNFNSSSPLLIGGRIGQISQFEGLLDEVEVFGRVLGPNEIHDIWAAGSHGKCKPEILVIGKDAWMKDDAVYDVGNQPNIETNIGTGGVFWAAYDIWVAPKAYKPTNTHPDRYPFEHVHVTPEYRVDPADQPWIYVKVRNRGTQHVNGKVELWFAKASIGFDWKSQWTEVYPAGVDPVLTNIAPGDSWVLKKQWQNMPSGASKCNHYCILARFISDPASDDPMAVTEGTDVWINTYNNNNVAVKNVVIVDLIPNNSNWMSLLVGNRDSAGTMTLEFSSALDERGDPFTNYGRAEVDLGILRQGWEAAGSGGYGFELQDTILVMTDTVARVTGIPVDANEIDSISIRFARNDPPLVERRVFHYNVIQRTPGEINPDGGFTYILQLGPPLSSIIKIEKTHDAIQGQHELVNITLEETPVDMGGFDFLIAYDASALGLQSAIPGPAFYDPAPDGCGWEYFTYRQGPCGACAGGCPSGQVRVFGLAETNNGPNHPSCFLPDSLPATLFTLDFLVSNDRTLECQYVPIKFFWCDCGDNTVSSMDGEVLYVSDHIYEFEGPEITDSTFGFPTYFGVQQECLEGGDPNKPTPISLIDYTNGGIDIVCADSIDDRGDINLNGVVNEVADAVLYSNYFVHGISVFNVNIDGQIAASDVNADGITLSVADLVYMIRIITGDALPYPKLTAITADADLVNGVLSVDADMGAAYVVVERSITPQLLAESMVMKYQYDADHDLTRILVYSMDKDQRFSGDFLGGIDGNVTTLEMATYEGAPVTTKLVPDEFALYPSYPNPFNPVTTISFALASLVDYELVIYNSLGQTVETFNGHAGPGLERIDWNASGFASGVYFYRLTAGDFTDTKKMVLLK